MNTFTMAAMAVTSRRFNTRSFAIPAVVWLLVGFSTCAYAQNGGNTSQTVTRCTVVVIFSVVAVCVFAGLVLVRRKIRSHKKKKSRGDCNESCQKGKNYGERQSSRRDGKNQPPNPNSTNEVVHALAMAPNPEVATSPPPPEVATSPPPPEAATSPPPPEVATSPPPPEAATFPPPPEAATFPPPPEAATFPPPPEAATSPPPPEAATSPPPPEAATSPPPPEATTFPPPPEAATFPPPPEPHHSTLVDPTPEPRKQDSMELDRNKIKYGKSGRRQSNKSKTHKHNHEMTPS